MTGRELALAEALSAAMYTPYLMFAYAVALALVLLGFGSVQRSLPALRGLAHLRQCVLCDLGAVLLLGLRSRAPLLITEVVPNLLLFTGVVFLYRAVIEILDVPPRLLLWAVGWSAAAAAVVIWFTYLQPSELGRLETHCAVLTAVLAMSAATLFVEARPALQDPARASAWLLVATMAVNGAWGSYGLADRSPSFLHPGPIHAAFSYLVMILTLGNLAALGWLSFCVHRDELHALAQTDALTGLLNRGTVEEVLRRELLRCQGNGKEVSIILVDIDHFKQVNDEHGHLVGDDVLRRIGRVLQLGTRPSDIVGRFGGEEFVIVLRDAGVAAAEEVAERLRIDIAALDDLPRDISLTASLGVAAGVRQDGVPDLLSRADEALYRSKHEGRNQVRVDGELSAIGLRDSVAGPASGLVASR